MDAGTPEIPMGTFQTWAFLTKPHAAIFKSTGFAETIVCPASFRSERGTEEAPLFILGIYSIISLVL